jgi:hypothetical protein
MTNEHNFFIKYQYCYMFRTREVIIRLVLEYFKRSIQIALLEMRSHILHNMFTVSFRYLLYNKEIVNTLCKNCDLTSSNAICGFLLKYSKASLKMNSRGRNM